MTDIDPDNRAIEPVAQFTLNHDDPYHRLAFRRVLATALETYDARRHSARHYEDYSEREAHQYALSCVIATAGRSYAAGALNKAIHVLGNKLDEDTFTALVDTVIALDLAVVEDLDGANGTGEDEGAEVRVFHRPDGWTLSQPQTAEACTSNHRAGMPPCPATAVWKVVADYGMHLSIGFWCDDHLPDDHRHLAKNAA